MAAGPCERPGLAAARRRCPAQPARVFSPVGRAVVPGGGGRREGLLLSSPFSGSPFQVPIVFLRSCARV